MRSILLSVAVGLWVMGTAVGADPAAPVLQSLREAEAALAQQEFQIAESRFRSALHEGWLLLGALERMEGRPEAARVAFERAGSVSSATRRAHIALAQVSLQQGEAEEAVGLLRGVVVRNPGFGGARRLLAQALIADGRHREAVQELAEMWVADPDDLETAFALAGGYLRLGVPEKVGEAEALFERLAAERPIPQTWVLIGRTYRDSKHFDRARRSFQAALEMDPEVRRANFYLGTLEFLADGVNGVPAAITHFERELALFPQDPITNLYYGMALAEQRTCAAALPALEVAEGWLPTRLDALRFLGRCSLDTDRPEQAVQYLKQALELMESRGARLRQRSTTLYQLGVAYRRLGAMEEAAHYFAEAEHSAGEIVYAERDRLTDFLNDTVKVDAAVGLGGGTEAVPASLNTPARTALRQQIETVLARSYFNLGVMMVRTQSLPSEKSERFTRAAEFFEAASEIDAEFPQLAASLGVAHFNAGQFGPAVRALARATEQDPDNADLRRMLALSHLNREEYPEAARLLAQDPRRARDPSLQYAYALSLVRSDRGADAGEVFQTLLARHGDWPELHVLLGQAHAQGGDYPSAVAALERALALNPEVSEAHLTLGILYLKKGELETAENALRQELVHHPQALSARYHLGVVLDLQGEAVAATEALQAVLQAQPDHADARYLLGKIRLAEGQPEAAVVHLEAAAALAPNDANVRYQLGQAYQRLGRGERAQEEFAVYRQLKGRGEE